MSRVLCVVGAVVCSLVSGYSTGGATPTKKTAGFGYYSGNGKKATGSRMLGGTNGKTKTPFSARDAYFDDDYYYDDFEAADELYDENYYDYAYQMYEEAADNLERAQEEFEIAQQILDSDYFEASTPTKKILDSVSTPTKKTGYTGVKKTAGYTGVATPTKKTGYSGTAKGGKGTATARDSYFDEYYYEGGAPATATAPATPTKKTGYTGVKKTTGYTGVATPTKKTGYSGTTKTKTATARNSYFDDYYYGGVAPATAGTKKTGRGYYSGTATAATKKTAGYSGATAAGTKKTSGRGYY